MRKLDLSVLPYTRSHLHIVETLTNHMGDDDGKVAILSIQSDMGSVSIREVCIADSAEVKTDAFEIICDKVEMEDWLQDYAGPELSRITFH